MSGQSIKYGCSDMFESREPATQGLSKLIPPKVRAVS